MEGIAKLQKHLRQVPDFRMNRKKLYPLEEILLLTVCGCLCGLEEWEEIVDFGTQRLDWLRQYAAFANGIPSHDTLNRVFCLLDPQAFAGCFTSWVQELSGNRLKGLIPIDGKAFRGTAPRQSNAKKLLHSINAWCCDIGMSFAQTQVLGKGNELAGIQELLDLLDIEDCIISIDAIGCQVKIATQIVAAGGDYILAVKNNQLELASEIQNAFAKVTVQDTIEKTDYTGGRIEKRRCEVIHVLDTYVEEAKRWSASETVIKMTTERYVKTTGQTTLESRYFISSLQRDASFFIHAIQQHWEVENKLHWHLDVTFSEDHDRKRTKNAATNFSLVRKMALNLLSNHQRREKISLHRKQNKALMDPQYLQSLFF
jgi:predicted transposase YbfD/YdcC